MSLFQLHPPIFVLFLTVFTSPFLSLPPSFTAFQDASHIPIYQCLYCLSGIVEYSIPTLALDPSPSLLPTQCQDVRRNMEARGGEFVFLSHTKVIVSLMKAMAKILK